MEKLEGVMIADKPLKVGPVKDQRGAASGAAVGGAGEGAGASANWKLDDDEGTGMQMNSQNRAMIMAKLAQNAGMQVPIPMPMPVAANPIMPMSVSSSTPVIPPIGGVLSRCILIRNMFDPAEERSSGNPEWDEDIKEDVAEECERCGRVEHCHVSKNKPGGLVFVRFGANEAAAKAAANLNGRFFAGRMITVTYIDPSQYDTMLE